MDALLASPGIEKLAEWAPILLGGFINSIYIAIGGYTLGIVIGLMGAAGKLYGGLVTRDLLEVYTTLVRAVPELILILLLYYAGSDLLNTVIPVKNVLFASEMIGAVRGIDPDTGHYYDDTKRYIEASTRLSAEDRFQIYEGNARRVFSRLASRRASALAVRHPEEVVNLFLGLFARISVSFFQLSNETVRVTLNMFDVLFRQPVPPGTDITFYLQPFALQNLFVHKSLLKNSHLSRRMGAHPFVHLPCQLLINCQ